MELIQQDMPCSIADFIRAYFHLNYFLFTQVFHSMFHQFNWTDISIIMDRDDLHGFVLGETLDEGLQEDGYYPNVIKFYGDHATKDDLKQLLQDASDKSRSAYLCVPLRTSLKTLEPPFTCNSR